MTHVSQGPTLSIPERPLTPPRPLYFFACKAPHRTACILPLWGRPHTEPGWILPLASWREREGERESAFAHSFSPFRLRHRRFGCGFAARADHGRMQVFVGGDHAHDVGAERASLTSGREVERVARRVRHHAPRLLYQQR